MYSLIISSFRSPFGSNHLITSWFKMGVSSILSSISDYEFTTILGSLIDSDINVHVYDKSSYELSIFESWSYISIAFLKAQL